MKKLGTIVGIGLIACFVQTQSVFGADSTAPSTDEPQAKAHKQLPFTLAEINEHLAKRQAEAQEATSKGRTDIATAIQKIIKDLNNMKTALESNDKAAFKAADEQRKQDHEALEALRKSEGGGKKAKSSN